MKYTDEYTREIMFPLGGIGTGSIGLTGDGRLMDWEIFNRPAKGSNNRFTFFAVRALQEEKITAAVLKGDVQKDFMGQYSQGMYSGFGFGPYDFTMSGFPHFSQMEFEGCFPVARVNYSDEKFPAKITMTAFNPFIPNDDKNSSLPGAFFEFEIENPTDTECEYQMAFTLNNPYKKTKNETVKKNGRPYITVYNKEVEKNDIGYGDLTITTDSDKFMYQTYLYRGGWKDPIVSLWNDFTEKTEIEDRVYDTDGTGDIAALIASVTVPAGKKGKIRFVLTWNTPINYNYWSEYKNEDGTHKTWKNYYATLFENSIASAEYCMNNFRSLFDRTNRFTQLLHSQTLPDTVIDAATANLSVLKSPTVLRLEDGSFYGWEGVHEKLGSCEGTCQHVWNYAYALCFLFPNLERSIRDLEFKYSTDTDGRMGFRMLLPVGRGISDFRACLDGQMGSVIKCYREWKISGDNKWLADNWDNIKKILEYAWSDKNPDKWDENHDGMLEGRQHHTLDMELFGASSWLEGMYLAALRAAVEMAEFLGDDEKAEEYRALFENGCAHTKNTLFNGEYFIQKIDICDKSIIDKFEADNYWNEETKQIKYQIGEGSSIDQMLGQWHADILGLGDIFDREQVDIALNSMMKYNYRSSMRDFTNIWRIFSVDDEAGSVICTYPEQVEKPKIPVPYSDETMTGFEYSFAGLLFARGKIKEGETVVKAVRDRFDGKKRNPWNEFECGSNYARSMASYAAIPILSGFIFDMPHNKIGFKPYKTENFKAIWSVLGAWGSFEMNKKSAVLKLYEGKITLKAFELKGADKVKGIFADGKKIEFKQENGVLTFDEVTLSDKLELEL